MSYYLKVSFALAASFLNSGCSYNSATNNVTQASYSYSQLRLIRQIGSATDMAELCRAEISRPRMLAALRAAGLSEADFKGPVLSNEFAIQKNSKRRTYEELSMTSIGREEALRSECASLARYYGPGGSIIPGLVVLSQR